MIVHHWLDDVVEMNDYSYSIHWHSALSTSRTVVTEKRLVHACVLLQAYPNAIRKNLSNHKTLDSNCPHFFWLCDEYTLFTLNAHNSHSCFIISKFFLCLLASCYHSLVLTMLGVFSFLSCFWFCSPVLLFVQCWLAISLDLDWHLCLFHTENATFMVWYMHMLMHPNNSWIKRKLLHHSIS